MREEASVPSLRILLDPNSPIGHHPQRTRVYVCWFYPRLELHLKYWPVRELYECILAIHFPGSYVP
jgi:hypothetical protein